MEKIFFEVVIEKKSLNNFISSKMGCIYPLLYESAFYVILKNEDGLILGLTKNYVFDLKEDVLFFKDESFNDISDINRIFNFYGLQHCLWVNDDYLGNDFEKLLLDRTVVEFINKNIFIFRTSIKDSSPLYLSKYYELKFKTEVIKIYEKSLSNLESSKFILLECSIEKK